MCNAVTIRDCEQTVHAQCDLEHVPYILGLDGHVVYSVRHCLHAAAGWANSIVGHVLLNVGWCIQVS